MNVGWEIVRYSVDRIDLAAERASLAGLVAMAEGLTEASSGDVLGGARIAARGAQALPVGTVAGWTGDVLRWAFMLGRRDR